MSHLLSSTVNANKAKGLLKKSLDPESFFAVLDEHQLSVSLDMSTLDHFPDVMALFRYVQVHVSRVLFDLLVLLGDSFPLDV